MGSRSGSHDRLENLGRCTSLEASSPCPGPCTPRRHTGLLTSRRTTCLLLTPGGCRSGLLYMVMLSRYIHVKDKGSGGFEDEWMDIRLTNDPCLRRLCWSRIGRIVPSAATASSIR